MAANSTASQSPPPAGSDDGTAADVVKPRTLAVRREGLTRFIDRAPALLAALESAGLRVATDAAGSAAVPTNSSEAIEALLIEDPYWCDLCDGTPSAAERVCPHTKRPHRRFLVLVAEALLKLVGEARAVVTPVDTTKRLVDKTAPTSADDGAAMSVSGGSSKATSAAMASPAGSPNSQRAGGSRGHHHHHGAVNIRRGIPVNPQLMLLAYHTAARKDDEIDEVHRELARHLVQTLELLKAALFSASGDSAGESPSRGDATKAMTSAGSTRLTQRDRALSPAQRQHIGRLVIAFARAWREYLRVAATIAYTSTRSSESGGDLTSPMTPMTPFGGAHGSQMTTTENAQRELVRSAIDTYCALGDLRHQLRARNAPDAAVEQVTQQMLSVERRIDRIGGPTAMQQLEARVTGGVVAAANQQQSQHSNAAAGAASSSSSPAGATRTTSSSAKLDERRPAPLPLTPPALQSSATSGHGAGGQAASGASDSDDDDGSRRSGNEAASDAPCMVPVGGLTPHVRPRFRHRRMRSDQTRMPTITSASESEYPRIEELDDDDDTDAAKTAPTDGDAAATAAATAEDAKKSSRAEGTALSAEAAKFVIRRTTPMGPAPPPNWSIGRDGRTHAPAKPTTAQLAQEKRAQLEFKAQAAYRARVNLQQVAARQPTPQEQAQRNIVAQVEESMWTQFHAELMAEPPVLARVPQLLKVIGEGLAEALPKKLRARVGQEIRDALDWQGVHGSSGGAGSAASVHDTRAVADMLSYVTARIIEFGAPAKEAEVAAKAKQVRDELIEAGQLGPRRRIADATVAALRHMMVEIRHLHEEIAKFGMSFISPELAGMAVEAAQEFIRDWMAPPAQWAKCEAWIREHASRANKDGAIAWRHPQPPTAAELQYVVANGILDLCASAKKPTDRRWEAFPGEVLYFERPAVFASANTLQFCTLRLMINNTVALLVSQPVKKLAAPGGAAAAPPRLTPDRVKALGKTLDEHLRVWLGMTPSGREAAELLSLPKLKDEVTADVNHALVDAHAKGIEDRKVQVSDVVLADTEVRVLHNVLEKVSNTTSNEYVTFEGRIVSALRVAVRQALLPESSSSDDDDDNDSDNDRRAASSSASPRPSPFERLGVIEADLKDLAADLVSVARLNVEVHSQTYVSFLKAGPVRLS